MKQLRLHFKLALLPVRRSWILLGFMVLSFSQILLSLWLTGGISAELGRTEAYAERSRLLTVQLKDDSVLAEPVKEALSGEEVSVEELKTEQVLQRLGEEEPEIVETIRSIGNQGLGLVPRVIVARGPVPDEMIDRVRLMTEVQKVDVGPVHHNRLKRFYSHLGFEMRIAVALIVFLAVVQLLVFHRLLARDSDEIMKNLLAWGAAPGEARIPGFGSLLLLTGASFVLSLVEWGVFRTWVWKQNSFLGELSVDRDLAFPLALALVAGLGILSLNALLVFSGRTREG